RLIVETLFSLLAKQLAQQGVSRFIVAGGETSGAVTQALDIRHFAIGAAVSPGVPWIKADSRPLFLLLKSGNFGDDNFFARAQSAE
ncbi:nucleotide-binding domain containing protein, partial [Escherichia coli]